jgi:hypothetical protein
MVMSGFAVSSDGEAPSAPPAVEIGERERARRLTIGEQRRLMRSLNALSRQARLSARPSSALMDRLRASADR